MERTIAELVECKSNVFIAFEKEIVQLITWIRKVHSGDHRYLIARYNRSEFIVTVVEKIDLPRDNNIKDVRVPAKRNVITGKYSK